MVDTASLEKVKVKLDGAWNYLIQLKVPLLIAEGWERSFRTQTILYFY